MKRSIILFIFAKNFGMKKTAYSVALSRLLFVALFVAIVSSCSSSHRASSPSSPEAFIPKREFRGAWMQVVNGGYVGLTSAAQQELLTKQVDALQRAGVNAVFFQVRPEGDALYTSFYEPWSRFLTGEQGKVPDADWDPLYFMINLCHQRGMELHAWINPYRAKMKGLKTSDLHYKHPYMRYPERFVEYDGMLFFNPALQANRDYICTIASDIVRRYDIDGLHIDDYFYPYPVAGKAFPDDKDFFDDPRGFSNKDDWRRDNVNLLVSQLSAAVHKLKPWVKFGVSPFGIYHNGTDEVATETSASASKNKKQAYAAEKKGGPTVVPGSATRGLQNYDDLYADVLLWIDKGWVDYTIPQLYWQIGHPTADYATLIEWWARHAGGRPLYIGQDLERSFQYPTPDGSSSNQLALKFALQRSQPVSGYCWWYTEALRQRTETPEGRRQIMAASQATTIALQPLCPFLDDKAPSSVKKAVCLDTDDGPVLFWTAPSFKNELDRPVRYVIYRFDEGQKINLDDPTHIVGTTTNTWFSLQAVRQTAANLFVNDSPVTAMTSLNREKKNSTTIYVVTALDRLQNESKGVRIKVTER